jgi:hypothetical protein
MVRCLVFVIGLIFLALPNMRPPSMRRGGKEVKPMKMLQRFLKVGPVANFAGLCTYSVAVLANSWASRVFAIATVT